MKKHPLEGYDSVADQVTEETIDAVVQRTMTLFEVPGMAVSVVHDGEVVYSKGHGVREIGGADMVDADTLFQIASVSKAFTTAALALLVDEEKLSWQDKVIDHLPTFRMYDPWVTREFTIRDLLTHRSGLGLGAGDLLTFPPGDTSVDDVIRAMRFLKPTSSFRSEFAYDNLLYIIAGEVIAEVSGLSFPDFVERRLMQALGMSDSRASEPRAEGMRNRATPHVLVDGELQVTSLTELEVSAAAGGLQSSANDMAKWLQMWLSRGKLALEHDVEDQLISDKQINELLSPVTLLPPKAIMKKNAGAHMNAYALGWGVTSFYGQPMYEHGGLLWGMTTYVAMLPEENLAVFATSNQMTSAPPAVVFEILDQFLGGEKDWIALCHDEVTTQRQEAEKTVGEAAAARKAGSKPSLPLQAYVGAYRDPWYGDIFIELVDGGLHFRSPRSSQLAGPLEHFQFDTFIARWTDRQLMADAYVSFSLTPEGSINRIAMKAVSPLTDFSYDFHDLDLRRVTE